MSHWMALIPGKPPNSPCTEAASEGAGLDALHLGWWTLQFTPRVALLDEAVVAELQASHRLFGGADTLAARIATESGTFGCTSTARAGTAAAALALARYPGRPLLSLPLAAVSALRPHQATLSQLGCRTLQDVMRLPRAGLSRRFGAGLLQALDQLNGTQAQAFDWLRLPAVFESRLELPGRVDTAAALGTGASILIDRLCAWLAGLQAGVHAWTLQWEHDAFRQRDVSSQGECTIRLASPSRDRIRLQRLMNEHLQRLTLPGPVDALSLHAHEISAQQSDNSHLFPELSGEALSIRPDSLTSPAAQKAQREALTHLIERLGARLDAERVKQGQLQADHRPELALSWQAAPIKPSASAQAFPVPDLPLPIWLLPEPQALNTLACEPQQQEAPFYQGRLQLLLGPHRVESGWWDGTPVTRDYYLASSERAGLLWVFRDRHPNLDGRSPWYLHGLFG